MHDIFKTIGNPSEVVVAVTATVAAVFAFSAWRVSKKLFRHQIMNDFFREFRSAEMGVSVKVLWDFWRSCGGQAGEWNNPSVEHKVAQEYIRKYRQKTSNRPDSLHNHRRRVSQFWQHVAILASGDRKIRGIVNEVWRKGIYASSRSSSYQLR